MMKKEAKFWDNRAVGYAEQPIADEASYQEKLRITQSHLKPDMTLLEFGCGTGSTAITHAPLVKHIHAIDVSPKMLEIARGKAADAGVKNIDFEAQTIEDLNKPDQSYDMVLGLSILHLLEKPEAAIAKVYRLLKPGGLFITSTVCIGDKMRFLRFIAPIGKLFGLVLNVMSHQELKDSMIAGGFTIEHDWRPTIKSAVFLVARKPE